MRSSWLERRRTELLPRPVKLCACACLPQDEEEKLTVQLHVDLYTHTRTRTHTQTHALEGVRGSGEKESIITTTVIVKQR